MKTLWWEYSGSILNPLPQKQCLSIYHAIIPLRGDSQDKASQGSWWHYSLLPFCALCFIGDYTEEGIPRLLAPSLLSLFTNSRDYGGRIPVALIVLIYYISIYQADILLKESSQMNWDITLSSLHLVLSQSIRLHISENFITFSSAPPAPVT